MSTIDIKASLWYNERRGDEERRRGNSLVSVRLTLYNNDRKETLT
jgi:hypothetical protein